MDSKTYRTKSKIVGAVQHYPQSLAIITNGSYQSGLSFFRRGLANLHMLSSTEGLIFRDGGIVRNGMKLNINQISALITNQGIDNVDLPLLWAIYTILLTLWVASADKEHWTRDRLTIYLPDLAVYLGKSRNIGSKDIAAIIRKLDACRNVVGVIRDAGNPCGMSIYPVLLSHYDDAANTVQLRVPYMARLIREVYHASIRCDKNGKPKYKRNGDPILAPSYIYLIGSSIAIARNKRAAEIVVVVVTTIEQAGGPRISKDGTVKPATPHLRARTIIERVPFLGQCLVHAGTTSDRNKVLRRAFVGAWSLIRSETSLAERYPGIRLPDPDNPEDIPTIATLDMTYVFAHNGKTAG